MKRCDWSVYKHWMKRLRCWLRKFISNVKVLTLERKNLKFYFEIEFQNQFLIWKRPHITRTTASIITKFCRVIETSSTHCGWSKYAPDKSKMADNRHLKKNCSISTTDWPILTKFEGDGPWQPIKFCDFKYPTWWRWPSWKFKKS